MVDSEDDETAFERLLGPRDPNAKSWHEQLGVPKVVIVPEWPDYPDEADFESIDWVLFVLDSTVADIGNENLKIDDSEFFACSQYILFDEAIDLYRDTFGISSIAIANYEHLRGEVLRLIARVDTLGVNNKLWMSPKLLLRLVEDRFDSAFDALSMLSIGKPHKEIIGKLERMRRNAHAGLDAFLAPFVMSLRMAVEDLVEEAKTGPPPDGATDVEIEAIREQIRKLPRQPNGKHAKKYTIVSAVGGDRTLSFAILNWLDDRGEYNGRIRAPKSKKKS